MPISSASVQWISRAIISVPLVCGQHRNQFLFAVEQIKGDEGHGSDIRRVAEVGDDFFGRFIKGRPDGQQLGGFALDLAESGSAGNVTHYWAWMQVAACRLPGSQSDTAHVDRVHVAVFE